MKILRKQNTINVPYEFNIIIDIDFDETDTDIAAAEYKGVKNIPEGELFPSELDAYVSPRMKEDYESFVKSIEELLTDYYGLHIYYKNESEYLSNYFGMVAKDDEGNMIFNFKFILRVANHDAHRSKALHHNKKEEKSALLKLTKGKKLKPIVKSVTVNQDTYDSYLEAYVEIDKIIEEAVAIMKR